jgi:zona occludens toxin
VGIKIHHGPDGTFKTSGAIKDDILPIIKSGRTLVTNVRGFSREKAIKVLGKKFVHKNFKVIFIDTEQESGRQKLARFFHWCPTGSFFVIDEVQRIFKPSWREKDLSLLSFYDDEDKVLDSQRPEDIHTAWDMQRHYSWDFVFTTTSITKVRSEMRDMAKVAVRHYNLGLWRFYKTIEHGADSRGTSQSSQGTVKYFNYVPKKIFDLYSSTKTGTFENSNPRSAFYKDPKVVSLLFFLVCVWSYVLSKPAPRAVGGHSETSLQKVVKTDLSKNENPNSLAVENDSFQNSNVIDNSVNNIVDTKVSFLKNAFITGSVYSTAEKIYSFQVNDKDKVYSFTSIDLLDFGYSVKWVSKCQALIKTSTSTFSIYCSSNLFKISSSDLSV